MAYSKEIWVLKKWRTFQAGLESQNRFLWNYGRDFQSRYVTLFSVKISQNRKVPWTALHYVTCVYLNCVLSRFRIWIRFTLLMTAFLIRNEILKFHDGWDRHKSVLILVHGVSTLLWRFIKKVRDIKKLEFSVQEQAWNAVEHDLWINACLWALRKASGPVLFQNWQIPLL